ncbi:MAG: hypothetical protein JWN48_2547 [Myxococcaceae bacterium]|nr:hypothetical protein [Myxococcaceae bacterium]
MLPALGAFCDWLQASSLSQSIQAASWLVPAVQTVHILAIALLIGAALALSLYMLGVSAKREPAAAVAARYLPVIWGAIPVLLLSGAVLIIAEPARSLKNPIFACKMLLLLVASGVTLTYQIPLRRDPDFWRTSTARVTLAKTLALLSLGLWVGVIFAGRFIAYVEAL